MKEKYDFFFMGCWNNETDLQDNRNQVLEQINRNIPVFNYNYGVILGDNIYPTNFKKKKKKKKKKK